MDDLLGLYGTAAKPAVATGGASASTATAHAGSDPFDTYWEQLGGSSNASRDAPKILSPPRKPTMPMAHAIGNPGLASFASMGFIPGPSRRGPAPTAPGGKPATAKAAAEVSLSDFDVKPASSAAGGLGITPVEEAGEEDDEEGVHHHDEEEDEEHDEEIDEPGLHGNDFDLLGFGGGHGTYTGAQARRRSSVTLAGATGAAAASGTGSRRGSVSGSTSTSASAAPAAPAAAAGGSRRGSVGGASGLPPVAPSSGAAASAVAASSGGDAAAGAGRRPSLTLHLDGVGVGGGPAAAPAAAERPKEVDHVEGIIWLRVVTAFVVKRWRQRHASLRHGLLSVWADRAAMLRGDAPVETLEVNARMALSSMKVNATGADGKRLFYRHLVQFEEGVPMTVVGPAGSVPTGGGVGGDGDGGGPGHAAVGTAVVPDDAPGTTRVFKFGCDSQVDFERWSRCLRASIDVAHSKEKEDAARSLAVHEATNAADLFKRAIASPRDRPKRRSSVVTGGAGGGTLNVSVRLLDGTLHHVLVARGATVKDVLVALRRIIGLRADADFSLELRTIAADGRETFACLPDVMPAEEAEALAAADASRSLVYRRRMYLPPLAGAEAEAAEAARRREAARGGDGSGHGHGLYMDDLPADLPDVDAEAAAATSVADAAHSLLYMEAVYNVTRGFYLLPLPDCIILAGLHMISLRGRVSAADAAALAANPSAPRLPSLADDSSSGEGEGEGVSGSSSTSMMGLPLDAYRAVLPELLSAAAIAEHKATSRAGVEDLLASIRREHARLSQAMDAFAAQRVYIKRVKQLPEYGASIYFATYQRLYADASGESRGSRSAAPTPAWAEALTCADVHAASAPKGLPVLVAMNAVGVHIRPCPPLHTPSTHYSYAAVTPVAAGGDRAAAALSHELSASERISSDGKPVGWHMHKVELIEVWGVKKSRPTFTYRVRENQLRVVELTSPSYKEMAASLHSFVFALLAQREGKAKKVARAGVSDYGASVAAVKEAARDAEAEAASTGLPHGWSMITDSVTGQTAYWNAVTKETVFSRPVA